jgi:hypothetical protein
LIDVFGFKQILAGNAMYCRFNTTWIEEGETPVDDAPGTPGETPKLNVTLTGSTAAGIQITAWDPTPAAADHVSVLDNAAELPQSRNFFNGPWARRAWPPGDEVLPSLLVGGGSVAIGQRWFFRFRVYDGDGRTGPTSIFFVDITA